MKLPRFVAPRCLLQCAKSPPLVCNLSNRNQNQICIFYLLIINFNIRHPKMHVSQVVDLLPKVVPSNICMRL